MMQSNGALFCNQHRLIKQQDFFFRWSALLLDNLLCFVFHVNSYYLNKYLYVPWIDQSYRWQTAVLKCHQNSLYNKIGAIPNIR